MSTRTWQRIIALVGLLGLLGAACGNDTATGEDAANGTTGAPSETTGESPATDGDIDTEATLRAAWHLMAVSLDPHVERHSGDRPFYNAVWDRLFELTVDGEVVPGLAESWEYSDDGTSLTLTIREGVTFHDGTPVTSEAAMLSIERARDLEGSTVTAGLDNIVDMQAPDDQTLELSLAEPDATIPYLLGLSAGTVINPAFLDADLTMAPTEASSAAYRVVEFIPDTSFTVERIGDHGDHWNESSGYLQRIEVDKLDTVAALNSTASGEYDLGIAVNLEQATQLAEGNEQLEVTPVPTAALGGAIFLRNTRSEFDDPNVRRALVQAIDREQTTDIIGDGCTYNTQLLLPDMPGYIEGFDPLPYDPEESRRLLAEAGLEDGFSFEMTVPDTLVGHIAAVQAIQPMLAEVGINMSISQLPVGDSQVFFNQGDSDAFYTSQTTEGDPSWTLLYYQSRSQLFGPEAETFEPLVNETLPPGDDRAERMEEAFRTLTEAALVSNTCMRTIVHLHQANVLNVGAGTFNWTAGTMELRDLAIAAG